MYKAFEVRQAYVPSFEELSFKIFWKIVCSNPKLKEYFPDNGNLVLPEWKYLLDLIFTIEPDIIVDMINEAHRIRKIGIKPEEGQIVEIKKDLIKKFRRPYTEVVSFK